YILHISTEDRQYGNHRTTSRSAVPGIDTATNGGCFGMFTQPLLPDRAGGTARVTTAHLARPLPCFTRRNGPALGGLHGQEGSWTVGSMNSTLRAFPPRPAELRPPPLGISPGHVPLPVRDRPGLPRGPPPSVGT